MRYDLATLARRSGIRRKAIVLRPIEPPATLASELARIAGRIVRLWATGLKDQVLPAYEAALERITRDEASDPLRQAIDSLDARGKRLVLEVEPELRTWGLRVEGWHQARWAAGVQAGTGVDPRLFLSTQDAADQIRAHQEWASGLIRNIDEDMRRRVEALTYQGLLNQTPRREIGKQLAEALGIARRRANLIAADQTLKLAGKLDQLRQTEAGIEEYKWRHSGKAHPRLHHVERDGKIFRWDTPPWDGHPKFAINCLPSWQPVWLQDDVLRLWRRRYEGELTKVVAGTGAVIDCTPNHPVLTSSGWKPAKDINVGDYLIQVGFGGFGAPDLEVEKRQPGIGNLFEAAKSIFGAISLYTSRGDFHGDATANENVDVVDAKGGLLAHVVSLVLESLGKRSLEKAEACLSSLVGLGADGLLRDRSLAATDGSVRRARSLEALFWAQALHDDGGRFAGTSDGYAAALKEIGDGLARDAQPIAEGLDAFAVKVGADGFVAIVAASVLRRVIDGLGVEAPPRFEVLGERVATEASRQGGILEQGSGSELRYHRVKDIVTRAWKGHVYNLETVSGWYHTGLFAVRNCGCTAQAYIDLEELTGGLSLKQEQERQAQLAAEKAARQAAEEAKAKLAAELAKQAAAALAAKLAAEKAAAALAAKLAAEKVAKEAGEKAAKAAAERAAKEAAEKAAKEAAEKAAKAAAAKAKKSEAAKKAAATKAKQKAEKEAMAKAAAAAIGPRDPNAGPVLAGTTRAMERPRTTAQWSPVPQAEAERLRAAGAGEVWSGKFTNKQIKAREDYMGMGYSSLNRELRQKKGRVSGIQKFNQELAKDMDSDFQLVLGEDMLLVRGVTRHPEFRAIDEAWAKKGLVWEFPEHGYFSTSTDLGIAESFASKWQRGQAHPVIFVIRALKGMNYMPGVTGEKELIFRRGSKWRVLDAEEVNNTLHVLIEPA